MAVYFALLKPGDTILGMNLAHGGHLTHGHPLNFSGKLYTIVPYGVRQDDERIDYDELDRLADEHKPKMIVVGASAYPRVIDFARIRAVADARRRRRDGRHGAHRGPGRRRRAPEPGAALRLRHDDDAQDAARPARRAGAVPRAVREGPRPDRVPRRAGRPADARHRGQGRVLQGSGRAGVRGLPAADRRPTRSALAAALVGRGLPPRLRRHRQPPDARGRLLAAASPARPPKRRSARPASPSTRTRSRSTRTRRWSRAASASARRPSPRAACAKPEMESIGELIARALEDAGRRRARSPMVRAEVEALCRKFPLYPDTQA